MTGGSFPKPLHHLHSLNHLPLRLFWMFSFSYHQGLNLQGAVHPTSSGTLSRQSRIKHLCQPAFSRPPSLLPQALATTCPHHPLLCLPGPQLLSFLSPDDILVQLPGKPAVTSLYKKGSPRYKCKGMPVLGVLETRVSVLLPVLPCVFSCI